MVQCSILVADSIQTSRNYQHPGKAYSIFCGISRMDFRCTDKTHKPFSKPYPYETQIQLGKDQTHLLGKKHLIKQVPPRVRCRVGTQGSSPGPLHPPSLAHWRRPKRSSRQCRWDRPHAGGRAWFGPHSFFAEQFRLGEVVDPVPNANWPVVQGN